MAVAFNARNVLITLDVFPGVVSVALFEYELRAVFPGVLIENVTAKWGAGGVGMCRVNTSQLVGVGQRPAFLAAIAAHNPATRLTSPNRSPAELARGRAGHSAYLRRAPKQGENQGNATGTMVYWDHLGNLRRVSDDAVLRAAS
jgi:hypothetical protein